jgi:Zn-dependent protease with chaperone function
VRVLVYLVFYTALSFVLGFPLAWYDGFAVEHQFGLSNQTFGQWMGEQGKAALLGVFFLGVIPLVWLVYTAIAKSPRNWWLWLAIISLPIIVAATLIGPLVVEPVFNKFTPLQNEHLKARILDLATRAQIPGRKVYQVDKSQQTKTYNAYVSGFGVSQRIVLWDTTLKGMSEDEILYVMGHEMGHYRLAHIWKGIAFTSTYCLLLFFLTAQVAAWGMRRFGRWWGFDEMHDVASLPLLYLTLSVMVFLTQPIAHAYSRRVETEADIYGLELTRDNDAAARAFVKLGAQNKSNPDPSAFVRLMLYSHPADIDRLRLALEYRPWDENRPNHFFKGGS